MIEDRGGWRMKDKRTDKRNGTLIIHVIWKIAVLALGSGTFFTEMI